MKNAPAPLLDEILGCERRVWQALVNGDVAADAHSLHDGFLGVYPDGFAGKADHVGQLDSGPTVAAYVISQPELRLLGPGHCLLAYRADFTRLDGVPEAMYVTSIWERAGPGWVNIFSQDTRAI